MGKLRKLNRQSENSLLNPLKEFFKLSLINVHH